MNLSNSPHLQSVRPGTLGAMFSAAREAKEIPIEQAAHETKIRVQNLRQLEADNLAHLSPAYARLFIMDYARYLGLSTSDIKPYLPDIGDFGTQGYQYIQNAPRTTTDVIRAPSRVRKPRRRPLMMALTVALLLIGCLQVVTLLRKLDRIKGSQVMMTESPAGNVSGESSRPAAAPANNPRTDTPSDRVLSPSVGPSETEAPILRPDQDRVFLSTTATSGNL